MGTITLLDHMTLDGVIQAPGSDDEDRSGGFAFGGWAQENQDEVMAQALGEGMSSRPGLLLGRRTFDGMATFWPTQAPEDPMAAAMTAMPKYVVSRSPHPVSWENSTVLTGEASETVAKLVADVRDDLTVLGSRTLAVSLLEHGLVDAIELLIHPLVLGTGKRLFVEGLPRIPLELTETRTTTTGVIIASYRPAIGKTTGTADSADHESEAADGAGRKR